MDHGQWLPQEGYHTTDQYGSNYPNERHGSLASQNYGHQPGHYDLLGPPDAAVPTQPSNIDTDDIVRYVSKTNSAPYAAGQRPQATPQFIPPRLYPAASGQWGEPHPGYHQHGLGGQSSTTANDSAYASLNATSGPLAPPAHLYNGQAFDDGCSPFVLPPNHVEFECGSNAGTESVLSESARRHGHPQGLQKRPRNPSDAQKHSLQHAKPFTCEEMGCTRREGFATQNDLQRHRSSVHHLIPLVGRTHGFICTACPPPQAGQRPKFWPRRDNFKAHVKRKHLGVDVEHLIQLSASPRPDDAMTAESGYGSHIDPHDQAYQQELSSPTVPGLSGILPQPGDYLFELGDSLAGVGVGVGVGVDAGPLADSGLSREPDFGVHAADGRYRLSVLSGAAAAMESVRRSPAASFASMPVGSSMGVVPELVLSQYGPEPGVVQGTFETLKWDAGVYDQPRRDDRSSAGMEFEASRHGSGGFMCPKCPKMKKRECDLRKHMKRHTRPYGCTFPYCFKAFGSRNDWKRHEGSQHCLQDMWKCMLPTASGTRCTTFLHSSALFAAHLRQSHRDTVGGGSSSSSEQQVALYCERMHLGAKAHRRFFCGFCDALVQQDPGEFQSAAEARYKHIGDHYDQGAWRAEDWVCVEAGKPKGLLSVEERGRAMARARGRSSCRGDDDGGEDEDDEDSDLGESGIPLPALRALSHGNGKRRKLSLGFDADADAENMIDDGEYLL
ncbi:hypothetical protein B0A55_04469 [Friedmanniomyces simplex]|uniref:C2H2-type domain-containing protein n=1 Tax=Friedmanniomyces simplex TaxID=329884 RepID=A0A4U0XLJ5_9PEZI|nr:hypothetical protein B0A55_04469 [Friedmanniomyces simplex]